MTFLLRSLFAFGSIAAAVALTACNKEDDASNRPSVLSQQGESCERTADCAGGLACFAGACRPADTNVATNDKECAVIQCESPAECCTTAWVRNAACDTYQEMCDSDPTGYATYCEYAAGPDCLCNESAFACEDGLCLSIQCTTPEDCCETAWTRDSLCDDYQLQCDSDPVTYATYCEYAAGPDCVCSGASYSCDENRCVAVSTCTDSTDCYAPTSLCVGGRCVECEGDDDCADPDARCGGGACIEPECETNLDCPAFYACQDRECVEVGCATDRECMVYEDSYLAVCNTRVDPAECEVRCSHDAECATASNPLRACVNELCVDPGCETDEECKILLGATFIGTYSGARAVCRDRTP